MRIKPEGRKLLVLPLESKEENIGGIIIPESVATADLKRAEVVEVSDELSNKYKQGDIVLYPSRCGLGQIYNGKPHLWLREEQQEIWGVEYE